MNNKKQKLSYDDEDYFNGSEMLPIFTKVLNSHIHKVFIDEDVKAPSYYRGLITILTNASEHDIVEFNISSPGGRIDSMLAIINAISMSEARTVAIVQGDVVSAATMLMLAVDEVIVTPNTGFMFHAPSYGNIGDLKIMRNSVDFYTKRLYKVCNDIYKGFFTAEEIQNMIEHSDEIYMTSEEVLERLKKRSDYFEELMEGDLSESYEEAYPVSNDIVFEPLASIAIDSDKPKKKTTKKRAPKKDV